MEGRDIDNFEKCVEIKIMAYNWIIEDIKLALMKPGNKIDPFTT